MSKRFGGLLAVDLFGERDSWAGDPAITFLDEPEVRALVELREVLGVLRADDDAVVPTEHEAPQPTLAELPALLADADEAGTPARLDLSGLPGGDRAALAGLPETASRTAFRVLQEALTNARKHAPGARVTVSVAGGAEEGLVVEIGNALPVASPRALPGAGAGLIGLAERVQLAGGRLDHGRTPDGRFELRAWLPWQP